MDRLGSVETSFILLVALACHSERSGEPEFEESRKGLNNSVQAWR